MAEHNETGKKGEEAACKLLSEKGFRILHKNWRVGKLELDIVAAKENLLVFVEVKTRDKLDYGNPWDAVSNAKIRKIVDAADLYIQKYDYDMEVRFDVMSVLKKGDDYFPEHIEDAFYPPLS